MELCTLAYTVSCARMASVSSPLLMNVRSAAKRRIMVCICSLQRELCFMLSSFSFAVLGCPSPQTCGCAGDRLACVGPSLIPYRDRWLTASDCLVKNHIRMDYLQHVAWNDPRVNALENCVAELSYIACDPSYPKQFSLGVQFVNYFDCTANPPTLLKYNVSSQHCTQCPGAPGPFSPTRHHPAPLSHILIPLGVVAVVVLVAYCYFSRSNKKETGVLDSDASTGYTSLVN